jgi:hypothetical protein
VSTSHLEQLLNQLEPEEALKEIAHLVRRLFPLVDEKAHLDFIVNLVGDVGSDKVSSLVHL